jgi:hypothetical protein
MPRKQSQRQQQMRRLVAVEAARIMSDQGIRDYLQAKTKAADRLGVRNDAELPKNIEIEQALREQLSLFQGQANHEHLIRLRQAAVEAMRHLEDFSPRLVGAVLEGTADQHSAVCLQVFADTPEVFTRFLGNRNIPFDMQERTLRVDRERTQTFPACLFTAGGIAMDVTVLPHRVLRQPPVSPVSGRPMKRASLNGVISLLAESEVPEPI